MNDSRFVDNAARRRFLRDSLTLGAGVTGVAIGAQALAATESAHIVEPEHTESRGYQQTQHVVDYYKSAAR